MAADQIDPVRIDLVEEEVTLESNESGVVETTKAADCFVAVHIGAGYHSTNKTGAYRLLCENICASVMQLLKQGHKARTAVATAVAFLENSPLTNAGLGSNLTLDEKIECDASIMDRDGFGSVGAVANVKNPIMVALSLLEAQSKGTLSMGRIVPCMLVGQGAQSWARTNNIEMVDDDFLKTETMKKSFYHYKKKLDEFNEANNAAVKGNDECRILFDGSELKKSDQSRCLDTVGAVVMDMYGNLSSAVSSGGILLKLPGRVGHASFFGCGCWVEEDFVNPVDASIDEDEKHSVAICTTGCGEYIIKTLFSKQCVDHILTHADKPDFDLNEFFKRKFFKLIVAHTTPSMCYGYMSSDMNKPKSVMSRMDENNTKESVLISNFNFNFRCSADNTTTNLNQDANIAEFRTETHLNIANNNNRKRKNS